MEMKAWRLIAIEMTRAEVPRELGNEMHYDPVKEVFKLKLTLMDEEQQEASVEREFLCVTGDREKHLLEELDEVGAVWCV